MTVKTNSMRLLDSRKVSYEVYEYSPEIHSAVEAAQAICKPAEMVYKTLVVMRDLLPRAKPLLVMVPGDRELDLRALALLNRGFEIWLDRAAQAAGRERICVNAGQRGVMLELRVDDLARVTNARWADTA